MSVGYSNRYGFKQARDNLGRFAKMLDSQPYQIVLEEAARAQEEAKLETPIETGKLQQSVKFTISGARNVSVTATASAEDHNYDYAKIQHDTVWYNHPRGGKAFYLRDPFMRMLNRIANRLDREVRY